MSDRKINALCNSIGPAHAYAIIDRLKKDGEAIPLRICSWRCHPLQALAIGQIGPPWVELGHWTEPHGDTLRQHQWPTPKWRFMQFPVREDDTMPPSRLYFQINNVILAEVVSLAVPEIPKFEDEFR